MTSVSVDNRSEKTAAQRWAFPWLASAQYDLPWIIGGMSVSLAFFAVHRVGDVSAVALWWTWVLLLDGPHIFATLSRTYLDSEFWGSHRRLLLGSLGWFALGPSCFAATVVLGTRVPLDAFLTAASLWAFWHVVRQHYGVMMLYKRQQADTAAFDHRVDAMTLYGGAIAPFLAFAVTHPEARAMLGLSSVAAWEQPFVWAMWLATAAVMTVFVGRQAWLWTRGHAVNAPKVALVVAVVGLQIFVCSPFVVSRSGLVMTFVIMTAFHNVQYHGVVWLYQRRRCHPADGRKETFGWATRLSVHFGVYAVAGVMFTAAYRLLGCRLGAHPGCEQFADSHEVVASVPWSGLATALMWGFALHHYYLDQKIWRPSRDAQLRRDLHLRAS